MIPQHLSLSMDTSPHHHAVTTAGEDTRSSGTNTHHHSRRSKKSVTFAPTIRVLRVLHINEYTLEEARRCWYSSFDYSMIKAEIMNTLHLMANDPKAAESDTLCFRGLETKLRDDSQRKMERRRQAINAVLSEQKLQRQKGVSKPEKLSMLCALCTRPCRMSARHAGLQDEEAVHGDTFQLSKPAGNSIPTEYTRSVLVYSPIPSMRKVTGTAA